MYVKRSAESSKWINYVLPFFTPEDTKQGSIKTSLYLHQN